MWDGINRRKFPRARYKAVIYIRKKDSSKKIETHTENIGAGGICVMVPEDLGLFHGINLELDLQNHHPTIKCSATVVWVVKKRTLRPKGANQYDTGIEFVDIDEKDAERIAEIVEAHLKKSPM